MLAASMLESNMAYCQLITGSWLPYESYLNKVEVEVIDSFESLNSSIESIVTDNNLIGKLEKNRSVVLENYHYKVMNDWIELYA
jgi:hypothetical protein